MTMQLSITAREALLEALEIAYNGQTLRANTVAGGATVGGTPSQPKVNLYANTQPANCSVTVTDTLLAQMTLPVDWMTDAANSGNIVTKTLSGSWTTTGLPAALTGTNAGYYRIVDGGASANCHEQGSITVTGGGGDLTLDNISIANNQTVNITTKTWTAPNP